MLWVKRMRAHAALFASIFGVVLVISALGVGISGYLSASAVTGVRAGLAAATGQDGALRAQVRRSSDPAVQDAAVRRVIAGATSAKLAVDRTVQADAQHSSVGELVVATIPLPQRAILVAGAWPTTATQGALQADAAADLALAPGDTITVDGGSPITVTATWRAKDPLDPIWFGDPLIARGTSDGAHGPLVVAESFWDSSPASPFARWTLTAGTAGAGDLVSLSTLADRLPTRLSTARGVGTTGVIFDGGLSDTAAAVRANLAAVGGVSPVPLLLIAVMSIVTLAELGRLLVGVRASETALLRSRGAAAPGIAFTTALEVAMVAVPAAAIGTAIAAVAVYASTGHSTAVAPAIAIPSAAAILAVVLTTLAAAHSARRAFRRDTANDSGRSRGAAASGLVVIVVAAAVFAIWQFRLYGSPLVRTPGGTTETDPVAVLAAPLGVLATAVLALALFPVVTGAFERVAARGLGLRALSARQLARRVTVFATPVVIVALAAGGATLAASYSATWASATVATRELRNGADVRLVQPSLGQLSSSAGRRLEGATSAKPVLAVSTTLGDDPVSFVASNDTPSMAGAALTGTRLDVGVRVQRPLSTVFQAVAWLADAHGSVRRLGLTSARDGYGAALPTGAWRLVALDVQLAARTFAVTDDVDAFTVTATRPRTDAAALDLTSWVVQRSLLQGVNVDAAASLSARGSISQSGTAILRFMPPAATSATTTPTIPVDITRSLATRADLSTGDPVTLNVEGVGRSIAGVVRLVVPAVPGMTGDLGASASLTDVDLQQLRLTPSPPEATELWISSRDPAATAAGIRAKLGPDSRVTTTKPDAGGSLLASARVALWVGAIGALLLAVVIVSAVAGALLRSRSAEVIVLRAVGVTAHEQASGRRRELGTLIAFSLLIGAIGGVLVSELVVGGLARSTVLDSIASLPTPVLFDPLGIALCLGGALVGLIGVTVVYGARVLRQAATLSAREEVR